MCCPGLEQTEAFLGHGLLPAALSAAFRASEGEISAHLQSRCHSLQLSRLFMHASIHHHAFPGENRKPEGRERTREAG